jgi:hypothetical protein
LCQSFSIGCFPEKLDPNGNGIIVEYAIAGHWLLAAGQWFLILDTIGVRCSAAGGSGVRKAKGQALTPDT